MAIDKIDVKPVKAKMLFKNPKQQEAYEKFIASDKLEAVSMTENQKKMIMRGQELAARLFNRAGTGEVIIRNNV